MLSRELAGGLLPQTLLFHGPDGSGKFLAALELAKILNCAFRSAAPATGNAAVGAAHIRAAGCTVGDASACDECRTIDRLSSRSVFLVCKANLRNSFESWRRFGVRRENAGWFFRDLRRLFIGISDEERSRRDAEYLAETLRNPEDAFENASGLIEFALGLLDAQKTSVISIERIRELQRFLWMKSGGGERKIVILDGAERMTEEAQNSFLKISEDTPPDSFILITCLRRELLKDTIRSRFRAYRFIRLSSAVREEIARERYGAAAGTAGEEPDFDPARIGEYFRRLSETGGRVRGLLEVVDDIVGAGQAVPFLSFVIGKAREKLRSDGRLSAETLCRTEAVMKTADFHRNAIRRSSANQELSLTDFILNHHRTILQW